MTASIGPSVLAVKDHPSQDFSSGYPNNGRVTRKRKINPWDVRFGRRLKVARDGAGLTQQQMADKLRLKLDTYQKYESGKRSFPKDLLVAVTTHTHYGPWFLLTGQPDHQCPVYEGIETDSFPKHPITKPE